MSSVVRAPGMFAAILRARVSIRLVLVRFYVEGAREALVYGLGNGPDRYSISAKLLTEKILMELYKCKNTIFCSFIDSVPHQL